jgi:hypothetical protein
MDKNFTSTGTSSGRDTLHHTNVINNSELDLAVESTVCRFSGFVVATRRHSTAIYFQLMMNQVHHELSYVDCGGFFIL